jgi:hypothetical protein
MSRLYPSTVAGKTLRWLLTIEWGGLVIRLSDDQVDVERADGTWLQYDGGLQSVDVSEAISLTGDSVGQLSIPIEFFAPPGQSIAERIGRGDDFSAARGELARWVEGSTYEERRVVLVGRLADPEYGSDDEPISTSLEEALAEDAAIIPTATAIVSSDTWPQTASLTDAWPGTVYPIIIGRPGAVSTDIGPQGWVPASPGLWADRRDDFQVARATYHPDITSGLILVVAGHHVSATRVYLNTDIDTTGIRAPVLNGFDLRGQPIAFVPWYGSLNTAGIDPYEYDISANYDDQINDSDGGIAYGLGSVDIDDSYQAPEQYPVFVGWYDPLTTGGGLEAGGRLTREAGDVLEYLLGLSTLTVDRGRLAAAKPMLSRFLLDGCISARVSPWEVLRDEILPLLPVSIVSGPAGLYPVVWRYDARPEQATHVIDADADPSIERDGRILYDSSDRANQITVEYAYSYRRQVHAGSLRLGAEGDEGVTVHPLCSWSRARTGRVLDRTISSVWVYDTSTAYAVAEWQAAAYCLPTRTVAYRLPEAEFVTIERGDVVLVTDSTVYLSGAVALVREVRTDGTGYLTATLQLLDSPLVRAG